MLPEIDEIPLMPRPQKAIPTELALTNELISIVAEYYPELPGMMQLKFDDWQDKLAVKNAD